MWQTILLRVLEKCFYSISFTLWGCLVKVGKIWIQIWLSVPEFKCSTYVGKVSFAIDILLFNEFALIVLSILLICSLDSMQLVNQLFRRNCASFEIDIVCMTYMVFCYLKVAFCQKNLEDFYFSQLSIINILLS